MSAEELQLKRLKVQYKEYYKNYSLLLTLGLIWFGAAYAGTFEIQLSILFLFLGITLFKPILMVTGRLLGAGKIHKDESLKLLTKLIIIGILFGLIAGFFPFLENINLFFPTFSIIFGLIFAGIYVSTWLRVYALIGAIMICSGIYFGYYYPEDFTISGFSSAFMMSGLGIVNGLFGKKTEIAMRFMRKKVNRNVVGITTTTKSLIKKAQKAA